MNKIFKKIGYSILVLILLLIIASCGGGSEPKYSLEDLEAIVFEDATFDYDGKAHVIEVKDKPEDINVVYDNNSYVEPGSYKVTATLSYETLEVKKTASLTINRLATVITASNQEIVRGSTISYSIDNEEQSVNVVGINANNKQVEDWYNRVGEYTVRIIALQSAHYAIATKSIKVSVVASKFDLSFESVSIPYDGAAHSIELTGDVPAGYSVVYQNAEATEPGQYFAVAEVVDADSNVVEKHQAVLTIEKPDNAEFKTYLDNFLVEYLEGDQLSINILIENPENFGLTHYDALWYTYTRVDDPEAELAETIEYFNKLLDDLHAYDYESLSSLQKSAYNTIDKFLSYYIDYYAIEDIDYKQLHYIDSEGGYVANFGTYMESYSLRSEQDILDLISYINSTADAFPSYLLYLEDKTAAGYPLSDHTLNEMIDYLNELVKGDDYYLGDILEDNINGLDYIDDTKKASYIADVNSAITNSFIPAVKELATGLADYLGKADESNDNYWADYSDGKELYMMDLQDLLGLEFTAEEYLTELNRAFDSAVAEEIGALSSLYSKYKLSSYSQLEDLIAKHSIIEGTPEEMLEYLKEFAKTIVPDLSVTPNIVVKEMDDASARVSNAVAYYMKSTIDNTTTEYITLNPIKLGTSSANDVLSTLAHEGYPGHLYAYLYSKEIGLPSISVIMTSTAHAEGWATHVSMALYEYAMANTEDQTLTDILEYLYASEKSSFLLETLIDALIHLRGYDVEDVANFLTNEGYSSSAAEEIYNLLIEMPTQYAAYGYGKYYFNNLYDVAKATLGNAYDEIEFNSMLLSKGWTDLGELTNTFNEYMTVKCYELMIDWENI